MTTGIISNEMMMLVGFSIIVMCLLCYEYASCYDDLILCDYTLECDHTNNHILDKNQNKQK